MLFNELVIAMYGVDVCHRGRLLDCERLQMTGSACSTSLVAAVSADFVAQQGRVCLGRWECLTDSTHKPLHIHYMFLNPSLPPASVRVSFPLVHIISQVFQSVSLGVNSRHTNRAGVSKGK